MGQVVVKKAPDRLEDQHLLLWDSIGGRSTHQAASDEPPGQVQPIQDLGGSVGWVIGVLPPEQRR